MHMYQHISIYTKYENGPHFHTPAKLRTVAPICHRHLTRLPTNQGVHVAPTQDSQYTPVVGW